DFHVTGVQTCALPILKQFEESEFAYNKVVQLNPTDVEAWLDFSSIYFEQGKYDEAIDVIADAIKKNPDASELYYRLVAYLFAQGKYNEALNFLELGLATNPDKFHILFDYLPQLQGNKTIVDIINKYKNNS